MTSPPSLPSRKDSPTTKCLIVEVTNISRLFRFVRFGNYFMLVASGGYSLNILANVIWHANSVAEVIGLLFCSLFAGFIAWVGWTNIGILGAVVNRKTLLGLVLFVAGFGCIALAVGFSIIFGPGLEKVGKDVFVGAVVSGIMALASFPGLIAILILRRVKLPTSEERLQSFLRRSLPNAQPRRGSFQPINRWKGWGYVALALAWFVGLGFLPIPEENAIYIYYLAQLGYGSLIYARHYLRPDFCTLLAGDSRPPVVFLRSFEDDEKLEYRRADSSWYDFSLESRLGDHFSSIGPFIAVGKPGDEEPHLGATRAPFSDEEWQGTVMDWMDQAVLIVIMIGRTHWVNWELRQTIERGYADKLIIVFPQSRKSRFFGYRGDVEERFAVIRNAFSETEWNEPLQSIPHAKNLRSLAFLPDGRVVAVTSFARNRESYHLAALVCHDAQLQNRGVVSPAQKTSESPKWRRRMLIGSAIAVLAGSAIAAYLFIHSPGSFWQDLFAKSEWKPIPPESIISSQGALQAGNFFYVDAKETHHGWTFQPGETIKFKFFVKGAAVDSNGVCNVRNETTLLNAEGQRIMETSTGHVQSKLTGGRQIWFTFQFPLADSAPPGEYRFVITLFDAVSDSQLEFTQPMGIKDASQSP